MGRPLDEEQVPAREVADGGDAFLLSLTADGKPTRARPLGGPGGDQGFGVVTDVDIGVLVAGALSDGADLGGGLLKVEGSAPDAFLAHFHP